MSLHASVACNCFERGMFRTPPPERVAVGEDGFPAPVVTDEQSARRFDEWLRGNPCEHPQLVAASVRLGNVAMIGSIRQALESHARLFPILLMRIVYSGSHTGDWLTRSEVQALGLELERLGSGRASLAAELGGDVEECAIRLREVWAVAMRLDKPILF